MTKPMNWLCWSLCKIKDVGFLQPSAYFVLVVNHWVSKQSQGSATERGAECHPGRWCDAEYTRHAPIRHCWACSLVGTNLAVRVSYLFNKWNGPLADLPFDLDVLSQTVLSNYLLDCCQICVPLWKRYAPHTKRVISSASKLRWKTWFESSKSWCLQKHRSFEQTKRGSILHRFCFSPRGFLKPKIWPANVASSTCSEWLVVVGGFQLNNSWNKFCLSQ